MPVSEQPIKAQLFVVDNIICNPDNIVLDVGSGEGKWSDLLYNKVKQLDGLEIWKPYIKQYNLKSKYDNLYNTDIRTFDFSKYDIIIFGDVLEHLEKQETIELINNIQKHQTVYVTIPISYCPQGTVYGNVYETHRYQWTDKELLRLGLKRINRGFNTNNLVAIGTYMYKTSYKPQKSLLNLMLLERYCSFKFKIYLYIRSIKMIRNIHRKIRGIEAI